jgi:superfamily II DNA or RNA helicase
MDMRPTYTLEPWQAAAVTAWTNSRHPERGTHHGILHVYTGAGKSVLAAAAMVEASRVRPGTKFAVVVPTAALAGQWVKMIPKMTTLPSNRVGKVGDGEQASFDNNDVVVYVLASARRIEHGSSRLATDAEGHKVMLIVDECHKAGSKEGQKIFDVKSWACLGLSATPNREDADNMDVYGSPLAVERQPHGRAIGPVCFTRDLRDGIRDGCLPRFKFVHHAVHLTPSEQREYDEEYERNVFKKSKALKDAGGEPRHYQGYISGRMRCTNVVRAAAGELQQAYFARKQFLYTASERLRIASLVLEEAFAEDPPLQGALIFNERVGDRTDGDEDESEATFGAVQLVAHLREAADERMFPFDADAIALEHSRMPKAERDAAIEGLRTGDVSILVSVKALQEGLDVPDVGLGMSIASTASGRQRIQTMGRILRPPRDPKTGRRLDPKDHPEKQIHFFFVKGSPDEELYRKESWGNFFTGSRSAGVSPRAVSPAS